MWIFKILVGIICIVLCLIGAILWLIPSLLLWDNKASSNYFGGVWAVYDDSFKKYDKKNRPCDCIDEV